MPEVWEANLAHQGRDFDVVLVHKNQWEKGIDSRFFFEIICKELNNRGRNLTWRYCGR